MTTSNGEQKPPLMMEHEGACYMQVSRQAYDALLNELAKNMALEAIRSPSGLVGLFPALASHR